MNIRYSTYTITGTLLFILSMAATSCRKQLYSAPISSTYSSEFWTSQTAVEEATVAMYGQLRTCLRMDNAHFIFGDLTTGSFLPTSGQWNLAQIEADHNPPFNFSYVPYRESSLKNWSRFYQLIAQANLILQYVPKMSSAYFSSESIRNGYIAEAKFMRAYAYFYMIRVWGDPVFVTSTYNDVDYGNIPALARTPEKTVLDSCLLDLKQAAAALSYTGGDFSKNIRTSKAADYALIAHIYAWQHNYDSAHAYCQSIIQHGGYSLEPMTSYTNIWKGESSAESIFELAMQYSADDPNFKGQGDWAEAQFSFFGIFLKGSIVDNQTSSAWISPLGGLFDHTLFDTASDARYHAAFSRQAASSNDKAGYMMLKYTNFNYQSPDSKSYPYISNNLILFRLSDIYLLDAEALAYKNDLTGAAADLAMTEDRAGITNYQDIDNSYDMIDEVVIERGRELIGEGQWFYDLIRTEYTQNWLEYVGYPAARVTTDQKGYYWPLDIATLFPYDNLLTQNPYWSANSTN